MQAWGVNTEAGFVAECVFEDHEGCFIELFDKVSVREIELLANSTIQMV